jgi:hypothetical protein
MDNNLTNNEQTAGPVEAIDALDRLLAEAHAAHEAAVSDRSASG